MDAEIKLIDDSIRRVPDFPKPGILFYDITGVLTSPEAFSACIEKMVSLYGGAGSGSKKIDAIAAVESRGFLFASPLAIRLGVPLILIRKKGKLPGETYSEKYELEYGSAEIEVHKSDIEKGSNVLVIDDLIATGGTLKATKKLIEQGGAKVAEFFGIIGLPFLKYEEALAPTKVTTIINFDSE